MNARNSPHMPTSLLWLSDDLYWKQDLSMRPRDGVEDAVLPFRHVPVYRVERR